MSHSQTKKITKSNQKELRARDIFLKWCDPKRKDKFRCFYSENVFVAERVPVDFVFAWKYDTKRRGKVGHTPHPRKILK